MNVSPVKIEAEENDSSLDRKPVDSQSHIAITALSLIFSILQSMCTAVVAINGVRLAIGLGSLTMSAGLGAEILSFHHITWLRISLLLGGLSGSIPDTRDYSACKEATQSPSGTMAPARSNAPRAQDGKGTNRTFHYKPAFDRN
jgi:hypothetical protein